MSKVKSSFLSPICLPTLLEGEVLQVNSGCPSSPASTSSDGQTSRGSSGYESMLWDSSIDTPKELTSDHVPVDNITNIYKDADDALDDSLVNYNFQMYPSIGECLSDKITLSCFQFWDCNARFEHGLSSSEYKQFETNYFLLQKSSIPLAKSESSSKCGSIERPIRSSSLLGNDFKADIDNWLETEYGEEVENLIKYLHSGLADSKRQQCIQLNNSCTNMTPEFGRFNFSNRLSKSCEVQRSLSLYPGNTPPLRQNNSHSNHFVTPDSNFKRKLVPSPSNGGSTLAIYRYMIEPVVNTQWQNRTISGKTESLCNRNISMAKQQENIWIRGRLCNLQSF